MSSNAILPEQDIELVIRCKRRWLQNDIVSMLKIDTHNVVDVIRIDPTKWSTDFIFIRIGNLVEPFARLVENVGELFYACAISYNRKLSLWQRISTGSFNLNRLTDDDHETKTMDKLQIQHRVNGVIFGHYACRFICLAFNLIGRLRRVASLHFGRYFFSLSFFAIWWPRMETTHLRTPKNGRFDCFDSHRWHFARFANISQR